MKFVKIKYKFLIHRYIFVKYILSCIFTYTSNQSIPSSASRP